MGMVTISKDPEPQPLPEVPFISDTEGYQAQWLRSYSTESKERKRIEYLAERRNRAIGKLLDHHPGTSHIFLVDTYYLNQKHSLRKLLSQYFDSSILGGSTWYPEYPWPHRRKLFWDTWTTPEGAKYDWNDKGTICVRAVGGAVIFPVSAWKEVDGFQASCFPDGSEINHLCENAGLPVIMSLDAKFIHPAYAKYGFWKTLHVKLGKLT